MESKKEGYILYSSTVCFAIYLGPTYSLNCDTTKHFVMGSIRARLCGGVERTRYFPLYVTIGNVMREFVSGSKPGKLLGVMPLAGTRARSRNNGNRLNKYLPFPPPSTHSSKWITFYSRPGSHDTAQIQCINAAEPSIIRLSQLCASSKRRVIWDASLCTREVKISMAVETAHSFPHVIAIDNLI